MQLNLIEIFASVQGETSFTGLPTTFIRLAACNLRCTWCDTTYSFGRGTTYTLEAILQEVEDKGCQHICVTGGEPLLQKDVHTLMQMLCDRHYTVSLETSGSLPIDEVDPRVHIIIDVKCPKSGMEHKNLWANMPLIAPKDEVKFVVMDREDYEYSREIISKYALTQRNIPVLLSPVHGKLDLQLLVKWILEDKLKVRLNLQIHKFIWTPETKGV